MGKSTVRKKLNPSRKQATEADVRKARVDGREEGLYFAANIMFSCLLDKKGVDIEFLQSLWADFDKLLESINEHRVSYADLRRVLRDEYDIRIGDI